jgi:hypothetical protein
VVLAETKIDWGICHRPQTIAVLYTYYSTNETQNTYLFHIEGIRRSSHLEGVAHHDILPDHCDTTFPRLNDTLYDPPYATASPYNKKRGRDERSDNPHARRTHRIPLLAGCPLDTGQTSRGTRVAKGKRRGVNSRSVHFDKRKGWWLDIGVEGHAQKRWVGGTDQDFQGYHALVEYYGYGRQPGRASIWSSHIGQRYFWVMAYVFIYSLCTPLSPLDTCADAPPTTSSQA